MAGYQTQQRKALLDYLYRHPGSAMTAQALAHALRADPRTQPKPGESTVYRQLQRLSREGIIKRYLLEGSRCYVYEMPGGTGPCGGHLHMRCTSCDKLIHLGEEPTSLVAREAGRAGFALDKEHTMLLGRCAACRKEEP